MTLAERYAQEGFTFLGYTFRPRRAKSRWGARRPPSTGKDPRLGAEARPRHRALHRRGVDDARLETLFLTMPLCWKGTLVQ
jgi:hypothetical protein